MSRCIHRLCFLGSNSGRFIIFINYRGIGARTRRVGQAYTDLFVLYNPLYELPDELGRRHKV